MASPADHPRCLSPAGPWCDGLNDHSEPLGSLKPGLVVVAGPRVVLRREPGGPTAPLPFCPFCAAPLAPAAPGSGRYYVFSPMYTDGNHHAVWWAPENSGYRYSLEEAGVYTEAQIREAPHYYDNGDRARAIPVELVWAEGVVATTVDAAKAYAIVRRMGVEGVAVTAAESREVPHAPRG